ncbi:unnamed protein product [Timema podura]|uniref:Uncharacterized protein n=1 Tax=Timema podura TaxID=61482 RepID=A0ABN7PFN2_TIMPD|nr:unnamed protein product [Timema podura]
MGRGRRFEKLEDAPVGQSESELAEDEEQFGFKIMFQWDGESQLHLGGRVPGEYGAVDEGPGMRQLRLHEADGCGASETTG